MFGRKREPACDHEWRVTGARYTPPIRRSVDILGFISDEFFERVLWGITTITQRCVRCNRTDVIVRPGKVDVPGFVWGPAGSEAVRN
jgi:hypothetical protein